MSFLIAATTSSTFSRSSLNVSTIRSVSVGISRSSFCRLRFAAAGDGVSRRCAIKLTLAELTAEEVFALGKRARKLLLHGLVRVDGVLANGVDALLDQELRVERFLDRHEDTSVAG